MLLNTTKYLLEPSHYLTKCQCQESSAKKEAGRSRRRLYQERDMIRYEVRQEEWRGNKEGTDVRHTWKNQAQVSSFPPKPHQNEKRNRNMKENLLSC